MNSLKTCGLINGKALLDGVDPSLISEAKRKELRQLKNRRTLDPVQQSQLEEGTPVVGTRWVVTNKGTATAPKIKARLVCQEFATHKDFDLFSGTLALSIVKCHLADWFILGYKLLNKYESLH